MEKLYSHTPEIPFKCIFGYGFNFSFQFFKIKKSEWNYIDFLVVIHFPSFILLISSKYIHLFKKLNIHYFNRILSVLVGSTFETQNLHLPFKIQVLR